MSLLELYQLPAGVVKDITYLLGRLGKLKKKLQKKKDRKDKERKDKDD